MVKCRFAPMKVDLVGFDFEGIEDFQGFINQMSEAYGKALGVFCVTLPLKYRKEVDALLLKAQKSKPIKVQHKKKS